MTAVKYLRWRTSSYICEGDLSALLEWRHSTLIPFYCNLCVSNNFNWWLSNKAMKLRVLMKKALLVFLCLIFIILSRGLATRYSAVFLIQEATEESLYSLLFVEHSNQVDWRNWESTTWLLTQKHTHTSR